MTTPNRTAALETCFISAPAGAKLGALRACLQSRGLRILVPQDFALGADWASESEKQLSQADLVIGVLTKGQQSPWVLFELGQASALGRRIVLITPPEADPIPFPLHQFLVLRTDLENQEAIGFALDQMLSAPNRAKRQPTPQSPPLAGLGAKTDDLIALLERSLVANDFRSLERVVADALVSSGTDVVAQSHARDTGADFAVWSDVLEPFVGNPLLVEVKGRIRGKTEAKRAVKQLQLYISGAAGSRWALLLYGDGPDPQGPTWAETPPNVLVLSIRALLEALRTRAFPELVRDLRNRRVHGSSS